MITGTEIFEKHMSGDYMLLKKKNPRDNLSKELVMSGYTLEEMPSL